MKTTRIINQTRGTVLAEECEIASSFWERTRGLMMRPELPEGCGLFIEKTPSIHMFNMKFAIDAVFVTGENVVTDICENLGRRKMYVAKNRAGKPDAVIELPVGTIAKSSTQIGDVLQLETNDFDDD
jgi:uncharacterized protein